MRFTFTPDVLSTHYSHLSSLIHIIAEDDGINVRVGFFWKKLVHKCNKRGVEEGKNLEKSINNEGGNVRGKKIKIDKRVSMFNREMRVHTQVAIWKYQQVCTF